MYVTKVVDFFAKIPEQLILQFSDFSTIFKRIYKFAVFQNKRKRKRKLASRPLEQFGGSHITPWPALEQRRGRRGSCRGRGRPGAGSAVEQRFAGCGERRRRRSSGSGRRGACRGDSADHKEASSGVDLSRGGAEQARRRPTGSGGGSCSGRRRSGGLGRGWSRGRGASRRRGEVS